MVHGGMGAQGCEHASGDAQDEGHEEGPEAEFQ